jgi:hypothetical protein
MTGVLHSTPLQHDLALLAVVFFIYVLSNSAIGIKMEGTSARRSTPVIIRFYELECYSNEPARSETRG